MNTSIIKIDEFLKSSEIVGIIVGQSDSTNNPQQLHCGIGYEYQEKFNIIHLAWHFMLQNEEFNDNFSNYIILKSKIHISRQNSIAAMCRLILKRHNEKKIPYGLLYSGGSFTKEGLFPGESPISYIERIDKEYQTKLGI